MFNNYDQREADNSDDDDDEKRRSLTIKGFQLLQPKEKIKGVSERVCCCCGNLLCQDDDHNMGNDVY